MRFWPKFSGLIIMLPALLTIILLSASAIAQVPQITQLVPASAAPQSILPTLGSAITVNGTGFTSNSVVRWNGAPRSTNFISTTRLSAVITAADVELPGTAWVTVTNPTTTVASNVAYFEISTPIPSASFTSTDFAADSWPAWIAVGDFNGDGRLDMGVVNFNSGDVSILIGNGDGTFQPAVNVAGRMGTPRSIALGDVNGDGKLDFVTTNFYSSTIDVWLGNGDGTFQAPMTYGVGGLPYSATVADLNGDGKLDIVTGNVSGNNISVLLGNGDGTFQPAVNYASGTQSQTVVAADFDADGKLDLAVGSSDGVYMFLGNGDGTFKAGVSCGEPAGTLAVADLNGDGNLDLVTGSVGVMLGNGDGTFQPVVNYGAPGIAIALGDFNADSKLDIAVATGGNAAAPVSVCVLQGNADGTFQAPVFLPAGYKPYSVAVGDFNGDGRTDFAVANNGSDSVSVLLSLSPFGPTPTPTPTPTATPTPRPSSDFANLPQRRPSDLFTWNTDQGIFVIDYGSGPGTPGGLLTSDAPGFCQVARTVLGDLPVSVTYDSQGHLVANSDDLLSLQSSLPDDYKWVGLATVSVCNGIQIKPPKLACPQMREYFHQLTGEYPEDMIIDPLPIPSDLKDFLKQRFNVCTGLDLSGLDCQQKIDLAAELSSLTMPGVGQLLNSPIAKFLIETIFCELHIDIDLPNIDLSFPSIDFGFGGGCWFGCGDAGSSGGGDGGPPYWFPDPNGQASYDCRLVPADWTTMTWGDVSTRAAAAGVSVPTMLNSIVACTSPYPINGFPLTQVTPVITLTASSVTYDGAAHPVTAAVTGIGTNSVPGTLSISYAPGVDTPPVNAGIYTVTATFTSSSSKYTNAVVSTSFEILQATPFVTSSGGTFSYDGNPHSASGSVTGVNGENLGAPSFTYNGSFSPPVSVGIYGIVATFVGSANYKSVSNNSAQIIIRDTTAPLLTLPANITTEATSSAGAIVIYTASANDDVEGPVTVNCAPPSGSTFPLGLTTVQCLTQDAAGNISHGSFTVTVHDTTPPTVSCPAPVTASADSNCQAHVPNVLSNVSASDCDGPVTLSQSPAAGTLVGLGATTITVTATDAAHNSTSCTTTFTVTDNTPPTITITTPSNGTAYLLNQSVAANYGCTDCGGISSCSGPVANGSNIDTASAGTKTFTVSGSDHAGNNAAKSVNYQVSFGVRVLFDQSKAAKSGSTIPIKIQLVDANGNNVSSPAFLVHALSVIQTSSSASVLLNDAGDANPDFDFRYDSSLGGYIFNLKTTGYATGSYLMNFSAGADPMSHSVQFQVRQ